uniref:Chromo domain-containing protein n=1 Tax=Panagrellus redivivus TaxID=6233 RepID=A0A7E4US14_PANRE
MSESPARFQVRTGKRKCEEAYEIKQIIGHRKRQRKQEFEVAWWGYDTTDWITAQNFCTPGAYDLLTKYRAEVMGVKWRPKKYPKFVIQDENANNNERESSPEKSVTPEEVEEAVQEEESVAEEDHEDVDNPEPAVPEDQEENTESADEEEVKNSESDENENAEDVPSEVFESEPEDPVPDLSRDDLRLSVDEEAHLPPVKDEPSVADEDDDFESGDPKSSDSFDDFGYQEDWNDHINVGW